MGAAKVAYLGLDLAVRHTSSSSNPDEIAAVVALLKSQVPTAGDANAIVLMGGQPFQTVLLVQMKAPRPYGWMLMVFPLDRQLMTDMKRLSGLDLTLLSRASPREPWYVAMTRLPATSANDLAEHRWSQSALDEPMIPGVRARRRTAGVRALPLGVDHRMDSGDAAPRWSRCRSATRCGCPTTCRWR